MPSLRFVDGFVDGFVGAKIGAVGRECVRICTFVGGIFLLGD